MLTESILDDQSNCSIEVAVTARLSCAIRRFVAFGFFIETHILLKKPIHEVKSLRLLIDLGNEHQLFGCLLQRLGFTSLAPMDPEDMTKARSKSAVLPIGLPCRSHGLVRLRTSCRLLPIHIMRRMRRYVSDAGFQII